MSLVITPDFNKKTAKFSGTIAAGEHASITIKNAASYSSASLRLRVMMLRKTLAVFPYVTAEMVAADDSLALDAWETSGADLTCTLNLNTVQALKIFRKIPEMEVLFVLDDLSAHTLYFSELYLVKGWPQDAGDTPIDLGNYADTIAGIKSRLDTAEAEIASNADAISAEAAARASADTSQASQLSAMASTVAGKQDAGDYVESGDLSNLATKDELASGLAEKQDAGNYLTEHQSLSGLATKDELSAGLLERPTRSETESAYATKEALTAEANARAEKDTAHDLQDAAHSAGIAANAEDISQAQGVAATHEADDTKHFNTGEKTAVMEHVANGDVHVTAEQKAAWNAKVPALSGSVNLTKEDDVYALLAVVAQAMGLTVVTE